MRRCDGRGGGASYFAGSSELGEDGKGGGSAANRGGGGKALQNGGSGVVIVSYPEKYSFAVVTGSPTVTTVHGSIVYEFTASGSFALNFPCYSGTYYDVDSDSCIDCLPGEYQDENSTASCKFCPVDDHFLKSRLYTLCI